MPPPEGSWNAIATALDTGFDKTEQSVARRLDQYSMTPPAGTFEAISAALDNAEIKKVPVRQLSYRKWVAAAAVIIAVTGGWWYTRWNRNTDNLSAVTAEPVKKTPSPNTTTFPSVSDAATAAITGSGVSAVATRNNHRAFTKTNYTSYSKVLDSEGTDWQLEAVNDESIVRVDATPEAGIKAPLIRDANGKIIMDLSLLTTGNGHYISITGPNGEQTRISTKFAQYLMYLGGPENKSEEYLDFLIRNSNSWKQRFQEWRTRIMQSPDFIPGSLNFLDILELKDLLKENQ